MSLKKEIFSVSNIYINGILQKEIKILGIRIRFNITNHKFKIKAPFLEKKEIAKEFQASENNELYDFFMQPHPHEIHKWHHYFPIYYKHFLKYKNRPVNILEIGVFHGGSIDMWKSFFGENATVYGVDIDKDCKKYEDLSKNLHIYIVDQSNRDELRKLINELPQIDIVIDDGGHTTNQQIVSFEELYDKIAPDGVYLVEDLHTNYWKNFIDSKHTFIEYAKEHIDALNAWYFNTNGNAPFLKKEGTTFVVPRFTNITHSISFYDSIIVFEKQPMGRPYSELR